MSEAIRALIERARQENEFLARNGADAAAKARACLLADFEAAIRESELEALTLAEAEAESGYSYSSLQKKLASGELENVGIKGSPRVRRADLPKKGQSVARGLADEILISRLG